MPEQPPEAAHATARARSGIAALGLICSAYAAVLCISAKFSPSSLVYDGAAIPLELSYIVLPLAACWFVAQRMPILASVAAVLLSAAWMLIEVLQLQFLLKTGTYASWPLIAYAATNLRDVNGIALSGVDRLFLAELFAGAVLLSLAGSGVLRREMMCRTGQIGTLVLSSAILIAAALLPRPDSAVGTALGLRVLARLPTVPPSAQTYLAPTVEAPARKTPNIIIWVFESARADLLPPGALSTSAPFLNRLAGASRRFERAYTTTSHTSKALVGILCGTYPAPQMGISEATPGGLPLVCLPHALGALGYRSHFMQSAAGSFENRPGLVANLGFQDITVAEDLDPAFRKAGYFGVDELALLAPLERALSSPDRRPLLLTMLSVLTHHPYAMPGETEPTLRPRDAYLQTVAYVDGFYEEAYRLIDRHLGWRNTVLILVGDHGEAFGEHKGLQQHDAVSYEEVVRTPLLLHFPARIAPGTDELLRQHVDVMPTVFDLIGARWTGRLAGKSLLDDSGRRHVVTSCWHTDSCHAIVWPSGKKLLFWFDSRPAEVYDLSADPQERTELSAESANAPLIYDGLRRIAEARAFASSAFAERD